MIKLIFRVLLFLTWKKQRSYECSLTNKRMQDLFNYAWNWDDGVLFFFCFFTRNFFYRIHGMNILLIRRLNFSWKYCQIKMMSSFIFIWKWRLLLAIETVVCNLTSGNRMDFCFLIHNSTASVNTELLLYFITSFMNRRLELKLWL